ncbi:Uncharacterized protein OBRU01_17672 [Operophtera brumata]|uniref:DDE Tnp4 domain-containing protein n=1 Tax=Operophtera brumata TaxID=104452 RepID=A0A0L7KVZ5_OPEBR|nr:Uncharacterized protein OBRU01_17672 [Operophtera brumata]
MRTGDSNARLASIFKTSESTFQRMLNEGREALLVDYVPSRLGYDHMSREEVVSGPHAATTSDAVIMNNTIDDEEGLFHWFYRPGDVFILDRGFRDSKGPLEEYGYAVHMPETKHPRKTQLTTDQANKSRCVTICRWVVEVINGRFKRDFRLLRIDHSNRALSYMMDYFRIAAALLNDFHVLIDNNVHANEFLNIINERISQPNRLADLVIRNNYNRRRAHFQPMAANMPEFEQFPRFSEEQMILFALGSYQIKQARSYYGEHLQPDGEFIIELGGDVPVQEVRELDGSDLWLYEVACSPDILDPKHIMST